MSESRPTPFNKPNDIECAQAAAALLRTAKDHDNPQPMSMNECTTVAALLDRLQLALSAASERAEKYKRLLSLIANCRVEVMSPQGIKDLAKEALNDQSEPQPPQTQTQETKP